MARGKALEWAMGQAWAVTPDMLEMGLRIAAREGEGPEAVAAQLGRPLDNTRTVELRGSTAVIPIVGPIFRYADSFGLISGGVSIETLAQDFRAALDNPAVKAIVLNIDSPGGQIAGTAEFAGMVKASTKPVVAYIDNLGASAAYWIASAADAVVASETASVGSIGVITTARSKDAAAGEYEFVSSAAPMKRADPATEAGRAAIQQRIDDVHAVFEAAVAEGRGVSREKVRRDFGKGGVMIASRARSAGMVDAIGSFEGVIEQLGRGTLPGRQQAKQGGTPMGLVERFRAWASSSEGEQAIEQELGVTANGVVDSNGTVHTARPLESLAASEREELERLRKERSESAARERGERFQAACREAEAFADGLVKGKKILPAQKAEATVAYAQAALDDAGLEGHAVLVNGVLNVVHGERGAGRVAGVRAAYEAIPAHALDEEALPSAATFTLPPAKSKDEAEAARLQAEDAFFKKS